MPRNLNLARSEAQRFVDCFCQCGHPDSEHGTTKVFGEYGRCQAPEGCACRRFKRAPLKVVIDR